MRRWFSASAPPPWPIPVPPTPLALPPVAPWFPEAPLRVDEFWGCPWPPALLFLYRVATSNKYCPKCSARVMAASFPLGSIRPCKRSQTESTSPVRNLADVPPTVAAFLLTCRKVRYALRRILRTIWMTTKHVMIFVSEAISLLSFSHLPNRISPVRPSEIDQLLAVTKGGAKSTNSLCTSMFTFISSLNLFFQVLAYLQAVGVALLFFPMKCKSSNKKINKINFKTYFILILIKK